MSIWLIALFVLLFLLACCWINHRVRLVREYPRFSSAGTLVRVNDHDMSIHVEGNEKSPITLVFLAGGGTCAPILDFKSLFSLFTNDYRIAAVERSGYGFSEDSNASRDIDTMLGETREALNQAGVRGKLVLVPHSLSGIEALYWAGKYPEEISAIVGLDPTVPKMYMEKNIARIPVYLAKFLSDIGMLRLFPALIEHASVLRHGTLTEEEKALYRVICYRRTLSGSMMREFAALKANAITAARSDGTRVPMLFFISDGSGTGYDKAFWQETLKEYVLGKGGAYCLLNCSHYVHAIEYKAIFEKSMEFLRALQ